MALFNDGDKPFQMLAAFYEGCFLERPRREAAERAAAEAEKARKEEEALEEEEQASLFGCL